MRRITLVLIIGFVVALVGLIALSLWLVPQDTNPAFAVATDFSRAALRGHEADAAAVLSPELAAYVAENCPDGAVTACIGGYIPDDWGDLVDVVYRRSVLQDSGRAWDIQTFASFQHGQGFSGVCIYLRAENPTPANADGWKITRWAGWVSCDVENKGLDALRTDPDAPNHAP